VLSLACSKCNCSYHRHCVRPNPIPKNVEEFVCPECREIENAEKSPVNKYNHPKIDMHMLKEMLTTILEKIRTYPDREIFENDIPFKPFRENEKEKQQLLIVRQMSLKTIEERITNNYYKVTEAFFHDIRQLEHNWTIVDKSKTKTLKLIIKYVHTETNEMEACVHCFASSFVVSNWFTAPCKRPHLLIWAKLKGVNY
jgi:protein kinase C-binding protein 1